MNKRYYSYNRTHPLAHQYGLGDQLLTVPTNTELAGTRTVGPTPQQQRALNIAKLSSGMKSLPGGVLNTAVGLVGKAINPDGNTSGVGNFLSGAGDVVSMINPLWGAAVKGVGMLTNAAFGSNVDTAAVNGLQSDLISAKGNIGNSLTWDTLADNMRDLSGINVEDANLGSQGWFNHDVDSERNKLLRMQNSALSGIGYAVDNINTLQNRQAMGTLLASGGPIFKTDYDMGLTFVNAGGTHEQNPYGGVFMGMAPDGQPNQVEEGEVIFNDYVYSNRLKVPKAVRNKYKMREKKELSFADAIEEYIKKNGIEERNNDPIANRGLEAFASELAMEQEMVKAKKEMKESRQAAFGGHLFPNGGTAQYGKYTDDYSKAWGNYVMPGVEKYFTDALAEYNAATDDAARAAIRQRVMDQVNGIQKSYAGISSSPLGTRNKNIGAHQILFNAAGGNYGFNGNNGSIPGIDTLIERGYRGNTGDNAAGNFLPDDIYGWRTNLRHFGSDSPEDAAAMERIASMANQMNMNWGATLADPGHEGRNLYMLSDPREIENPLQKLGPIEPKPNNELAPRKGVTAATKPSSEQEEQEDTYDPTYWWRMAGLGANAAGLLYNIFDPYHPQVVNEARYSTMNPKYLGDYMQYNPYDINYATSQQDANNAATRNALMQSTAPIRNASLLANDFNNNATRGATRRQALEYNDAMRKAVTEFNRGTNQFNTQMYMDAASKNQAARQAYYQDRLRQAQFNSQLDFQHKMMRDQAIGQGLTSIADYLNDMGREDAAAGMADAVIKSGVPLNSPMSTMYSDFLNRRVAREQRRAVKKSKNNKGE